MVRDLSRNIAMRGEQVAPARGRKIPAAVVKVYRIGEKCYDKNGMRLTDCHCAHSTYHDGVLCCKVCYEEVPLGQGDGNEYVGIDLLLDEGREVSENQRRLYRVNIYDRDMQREMDIETYASSEGRAIQNGWFRLMRMLDVATNVGIFRSQNRDRYVITARLVE